MTAPTIANDDDPFCAKPGPCPCSAVCQEPSDWAAGYIHGITGRPAICPPGVTDRLAFASGGVEGRAARSRTGDVS
jgi:hypothetical protein